MRPGKGFGIRPLEVGFAIPEIVRSNGITSGVEGPPVDLVPRPVREAEEDLVLIAEAVVAPESDRSLVGVVGAGPK